MGDYNNPNENNNNQLNNPDPNQAQNNQLQNGQAPYQQIQNEQTPSGQTPYQQTPYQQPQYQQPQNQQPQNQSSQYQQYDQNQNQYQQYDQNQNQYQQYPQYKDMNKPKNNGMAIGSLVCGIISFIVSCCWFISLPLSIASIVLGILVLKNKKDGRTLAIIGIVLAGITVLIAISVLIIGQLAVSGNNQFFNEILKQYNYDFDMKGLNSTY